MNNTIKPQQNPAYGAASLTRVLNGISFPITKNNIINKYGNEMVSYSKSNTKTLKELVQKCIKEEFYTMSELVEACSKRSY